MNKVLVPQVVDRFLARTAEILPESRAPAVSCESVGRAWRQLGLRPGDVVLLSMPNCTELLRQFFGVLEAGGVPALLPPLMPAVRLREISSAMGARAIAAFRLPPGDFGVRADGAAGPLQITVAPPKAGPAAAPGEVVMLTSGTSGVSSGCVFGLESLLLNGERHAASIGQRADDTVLINLPLHFSFALVAQALASLVCGNRLLVAGPPFNIALYKQTLESCNVTISSLTPVLVRPMLKCGAEFLGQPRVLTVGGDTLESEAVAGLLGLRRGRELYLTYGLTQAGPRVATLAAHDEPEERYGSAGLPMKGTSVHLRPAPGMSDLRELCVSSETVMRWPVGCVEGRPSQALIAPRTIATGDAFEQDSDGYLYFKGRLSDTISRKGEKISLAAVRRLAAELPEVASARTEILRGQDGDQDFDLELCLRSSADEAFDPQTVLRSVLRRGEMPRSVRIVQASKKWVQVYK